MKSSATSSPIPNSQPPTPSIALVTDWITIMGGGEKVVEQFHHLYPEAPVYTSYCTDSWRKTLDNKVVTGYLQHWPFSKLRRFLPVLRQWWFARLDLSDFDIVISITGNGEADDMRGSNAGWCIASSAGSPPPATVTAGTVSDGSGACCAGGMPPARPRSRAR